MAAKTGGSESSGLVLVGLLVVGAVAFGAVAAVLWLVLWLLTRHPFLVAAAAVTLAVGRVGGPAALVLLWAAVVAATVVWRSARRDSFDRLVLWRWRRTFVYGWRWRRALTACDLDGLERGGSGLRLMPRLGSVRSDGLDDVVSVRPLDDQDARCFATRSADLARAFGAASCVARPDITGAVHLHLRRRPWFSRRMVTVTVAVEGGGEVGGLATPGGGRRPLPSRPALPLGCAHGDHRRLRAAA
jgi:hypothetical protein